MVQYIGARELKNRLGRYLQLVREGTTIYVTERGRPVAELRPLAPAETDEEGQLAALARHGLVAPRSRPALSPRAEGYHIRGAPLSQTVLDDREDRA
jgi:prevent-host-death family protein